MEKISFFEYEMKMAKLERTERRFWISILTMIGLLFGSNLFWIIRLFG